MKNLTIFSLLILFLVSCTKDPIIDDTPIQDTPGFSLKLDGKKWTPKTYYFLTRNGLSTIFASDNVYTFSWVFDSDLKVKTYTLGLKENQLISSMYKNEGNKLKTYDIQSGKLEIQKYDADKQILKAAFSFTAKYGNETVEVKDGKLYIDKFK